MKLDKQGVASVYWLDKTWANRNHTCKSRWKISYGSSGLKVPVCKGGRLIIWHVRLADGGFVPECQLIFRSESESNTDYHGQVNAELFKKWFQEYSYSTL
jgi:hypothetical protein